MWGIKRETIDPNLEFGLGETKVLLALWVKTGPMTYEEILAACVNRLWKAEDAQGYIDSLLQRGAIRRFKNGKYMAILTLSDYLDYRKRRRRRETLPDYQLWSLQQLVETRRAELEEEETWQEK